MWILPFATCPAAEQPSATSTSAAEWSGVVLRLEFVFPERRIMHVGTGFVIEDRDGDHYLLTCAHLIADKDWRNRHSVKMHTMDGRRQIESLGSSLHVGTAVDLRHPGQGGQFDMTKDLVIRSVAGSWIRALPLADANPKVGEWVWAVGCESGGPPSNEKLFRGRVTAVADGGFTFTQHDRFNPRGFSGGPVVNRKGEVVGNLLAGKDQTVSGATVGAIRRRLKEVGIEVD
jgi:S1-C subfamily serine protease